MWLGLLSCAVLAALPNTGKVSQDQGSFSCVVLSRLYNSSVRWPMQQVQRNQSTQEALVWKGLGATFVWSVFDLTLFFSRVRGCSICCTSILFPWLPRGPKKVLLFGGVQIAKQ